MSAQRKDESWTYPLDPESGVRVANPHTFDMQSDVCTKCWVLASEVEDGIVSYECNGA